MAHCSSHIFIELKSEGLTAYGFIACRSLTTSQTWLRSPIVGICLPKRFSPDFILCPPQLMLRYFHSSGLENTGTAKDLEESVKLLKAIENNFIKKLQQKTGENVEYVEKDDWFSV